MIPQTLIENNINLVFYIINKYYPTFARDEDIIQCGMLGLCKAANRWKESVSKFSTYASHCIRNEIRQELRNRDLYKYDLSLDVEIKDDSSLQDFLIDERSEYTQPEINDFNSKLSCEEQQILHYRTLGYTLSEISKTMNLSEGKVNKTVAHLKSKWRDFVGNQN